MSCVGRIAEDGRGDDRAEEDRRRRAAKREGREVERDGRAGSRRPSELHGLLGRVLGGDLRRQPGLVGAVEQQLHGAAALRARSPGSRS